jgi:hypothetical protein
MKSPADLLFLLCLPSLLGPSLCAQSLHGSPQWPSDHEFITVNRAVEEACTKHPGVEEELVWALLWEESKYDPLAVGLKGEVGLGQLMPATARALGVKDRTDIGESVDASVRHLTHLSKKYRNNMQLVLAAYNVGEPIVNRCRCVPTASRGYVDRIQQNRFFAKRIVGYLRESVLPAAAQAATVATLEAKLKRLEQERQKEPNASSSQRVDLERELAQARSDLERAQAASDRLRAERDRLLAQLQTDNSLGAQALAVTQSLRERLGALESQVASRGKDSQSGAETNFELAAIRADLAQLKSVIQNPNVQDTQTQQRIAELTALVAQLSAKVGSSSARVPLASAKTSKDSPLIMVIAAADHAGRVEPDPQLSGALQDALLRKGLAVNVDVQTAQFVAHNLSALLAGDGKALRKAKSKQGRNWDYAVVLQVTSGTIQNGWGDTRSFVVTADFRLYTVEGRLLSLRTFSQTGAGFTDLQASEAAITRLGQTVGEFLDVSIQR